MNSKAIVSAIMAMSLSAAGFAFGQTFDYPPDRLPSQPGAAGQGVRGNQVRQPVDRQNQVRQPVDRQNQARQPVIRQNQGRMNNYVRQDERGAGPNHQFRRGDRLPYEYRSRQYVVDDWRGHHLNRPPRGYHWVQSGNDYFLVAIATGVILQLFMNN